MYPELDKYFQREWPENKTQAFVVGESKLVAQATKLSVYQASFPKILISDHWQVVPVFCDSTDCPIGAAYWHQFPRISLYILITFVILRPQTFIRELHVHIYIM